MENVTLFGTTEYRDSSSYDFSVQKAKNQGGYVKVSLSRESIANLLMGRPILLEFVKNDGEDATELCIDLQFTDGTSKAEAFGGITVDDPIEIDF